MEIQHIHHVAIICSDYERSKRFYTEILGFEVAGEFYRPERNSYKLDLSLNGQYAIELFSFPDPPRRLTGPEALGLRHIAFAVKDITASIAFLESKGITVEPVRTDAYTDRKFAFFRDPDDLPIEIYESI